MFKFWTDMRGNVAIVFALAAPILLASMGLAVDYTSWTGQARKLQGIADIAALAAAKELYLANADSGQITSVANSVAQAQLTLDGPPHAPVGVAAQVLDSGDSVEVVVTQDRRIYFANMIVENLDPLSARAVARAVGGGRICVISLDETAVESLSMMNSAILTAQQCGVYSNSVSSNGIRMGGTSHMHAELICSAGGVDGTSSHFNLPPLTDCPKIADPLASRPAPTYGGCDFTDTKITKQTLTISPGVYCGGLTIQSGSDIFFDPGIYIIKDGPLTIGSNSAVEGENVGFYFEGDTSTFTFVSSASVSFTAPKDGPLAGILFFEARGSLPLREFKILSDNARMLLGTFYLPEGVLKVSTNTPVADQSAYTAIIARQLQLQQAPNLVLNADYGATDIPAPAGITASGGGNIVLMR